MHRQIYDEPPKPSAGNAAIGADLEALILKLLVKVPDERFSTGLELVEALASIKADAGVEKSGVVKRGSKKGKSENKKAAAGKPTLVRRDTRVAVKLDAGRVPPSPASGQTARPRRFRLGPVLVAVVVLASAWSGGNLLGHWYLDKKPKTAVAGEGRRERKSSSSTSKKSAKVAGSGSDATAAAIELGAVVDTSVTTAAASPVVESTSGVSEATISEPVPVVSSPAPVEYRRPAPTSKPAPSGAPAPVPIVVE